jgi:hypothetical protein
MDDLSEPASVQAAVESILEEATEPLYFVRPSAELLEIVVKMATDHDTPPLHVLAAEPELKAVRNYFPSASRAADLVKADRLTLTPAVPDGWGTAVMTTEAAHAFADVGGQEFVLEGAAVPTGARETCRDWREAHNPFSLRTPSWSAVTATLTEAFDAEVCADFKAAIETLEALEDPAVNEADSALLVAARHELLLYDLSHWAEDIQLYSKATLSRGKSELEDFGIISCEKVQIDLGRPRKRLTLTEEYASLSEAALLRELDTIKRE